MKKSNRLVRDWMLAAVGLAVVLLAGAPAWAQGEKRAVFAPDDFHWQASLKAGQTLEVINTNGEIGANRASGAEARVAGARKGGSDNLFVEVVEYADGVTVCAVYAKERTPGRCHRGGVSSDSGGRWGLWHNDRAKINFDVQVPRGVRLNALTTNGGVHCVNLDSVVEATTTNGNVEVSTSEWASAKTTNGGVRVSMGSAKWSGELELMTTNGSVDVTLPASAEFQVHASTTNGGIQSAFPITVEGKFGPKSLSGTVGSGGRELRVATTNGGIDLKKS